MARGEGLELSADRVSAIAGESDSRGADEMVPSVPCTFEAVRQLVCALA